MSSKNPSPGVALAPGVKLHLDRGADTVTLFIKDVPPIHVRDKAAVRALREKYAALTTQAD